MELTFSKEKIILNKNLTSLDRFVLEFTAFLEKKQLRYVIISGYVFILFGRSRSSEDVDMFVERLDFERFKAFWNSIGEIFDCINTSDVDDAYHDYVADGSSLRFAKKGTFIPNVEFKFPKVELDAWTLAERKTVLLNGKPLYISPLELQVSYKLFLGSEKDIEDAKYLYDLTNEHLDMALLNEFNTKLKTATLFRRYLHENTSH